MTTTPTQDPVREALRKKVVSYLPTRHTVNCARRDPDSGPCDCGAKPIPLVTLESALAALPVQSAEPVAWVRPRASATPDMSWEVVPRTDPNAMPVYGPPSPSPASAGEWKLIGYTCGEGDCCRIHEDATGDHMQPVYVRTLSTPPTTKGGEHG